VYSSRLICLTGELPENGARRVELGYIAGGTGQRGGSGSESCSDTEAGGLSGCEI